MMCNAVQTFIEANLEDKKKVSQRSRGPSAGGKKKGEPRQKTSCRAKKDEGIRRVLRASPSGLLTRRGKFYRGGTIRRKAASAFHSQD